MGNQPFHLVVGPAAVLRQDNIDTDVIIPVPWMKTYGADLAEGLFGRWRYVGGEMGAPEAPDFVLNQPAYRQAKFLIAGRNFGCGSSREQAVWALMRFGIRAVIAESFADIFSGNADRNGLLLICLPSAKLDRLSQAVSSAGDGNVLRVDLQPQTISDSAGILYDFDIAPARKNALLNGLDFIGQTLLHAEAIERFVGADRCKRPWIHQLSEDLQSIQS